MKACSAFPCLWAARAPRAGPLCKRLGMGYRLKAVLLMQEFNQGEQQRLLLRYTQALITQISQTAVCNRHHTIEQQLSRWLLLTLDRLNSEELIMTQELIASMLGVRREGIGRRGKLQQAVFATAGDISQCLTERIEKHVRVLRRGKERI